LFTIYQIIDSKTENLATLNWSCSKTCDRVLYLFYSTHINGRCMFLFHLLYTYSWCCILVRIQLETITGQSDRSCCHWITDLIFS